MTYSLLPEEGPPLTMCLREANIAAINELLKKRQEYLKGKVLVRDKWGHKYWRKPEEVRKTDKVICRK